MTTRIALPTLVCALALTVAGCGAGAAERTARRPAEPPVGAPQAPRAPAKAPGPDSACPDVTASLRPTGGLPAPTALPSGSTMAMFRQRGYIKAGIDQSSYPFGYVDPSDNELDGFDIDLLREVAKAIFGDDRPGRIQFRVLRNEDRAIAVARGDVDIVAETMTINCERKQSVEFSSVYFNAGQRMLVQKDGKAENADYQGGLPALPRGMRVCSVPGSTSLALLRRDAPQVRPVEGDTWADCLVKLQQGEVDTVTTDDTILAGLQSQDPIFTRVVGPSITLEPYGMAIAKDRVDFVRFVNAVLERLRTNGRWKAMYADHLGTSLADTVPEPPAAVYRDNP
ncbi:transporter substrate-binding domain-containing protein [Embleya sp. NBC_00896]|uniref:glutamate ABC transporter substrate-binding protein n=1 Tax=Embleya sp. NBC_00896 TaxID=2975961 RepID=UPI00386564FC|nr:transporter substrate-binding domain-containing protein [Embleya sp. NBC_00896]